MSDFNDFNHDEASKKINLFYGAGPLMSYRPEPNFIVSKFITKDIGCMLELAIRNGVPVTFDKDVKFEQDRDDNDSVLAKSEQIALALITKAREDMAAKHMKLSEKISELYGINKLTQDLIFVTKDSNTMLELAIKNGIDIGKAQSYRIGTYSDDAVENMLLAIAMDLIKKAKGEL